MSAISECMECRVPLAGPFCAHCGLRARRDSFTVPGVARELVSNALNLERGVVFTCKALLRHPGQTVRDYLAGRTGRLVNPAKYLLLCFAVATLAWWAAERGFAADPAEAALSAKRTFSPEKRAELVGFVIGYWARSAWVLLFVFSSAVTALLFRRERLAFAEHLIFAAYTCAQMILLAGLTSAISRAIPGDPFGEAELAAAIASVWYVVAASAFFQGRPAWRWAKAVLVVPLTVLSYYAVLSLCVITAVAFGWSPG